MSGSVWGSGCGSVGRALLPTPEICGSNLFTGKILSTNLSTKCVIEKTKIREKRPGMAHLKKMSGSVELASIVEHHSWLLLVAG